MKKFALVFFLIGQLIFHPSFSSSPKWPQIYEANKNGIPLIITRGGTCSGATISADTILTAYHCVQAFRPTYVGWAANLTEMRTATVARIDPENDLALLKIQSKEGLKHLALAKKGSVPKVGEPVATIGHPVRHITDDKNKLPFSSDDTYLMSAGIVSGVVEKDLIVDLSVSPGNSGGPVFNDNGEIVGIVSRKRIDGIVGDIGYATNSSVVHEMIETQNKEGDQKLGFFDAKGGAKVNLGVTTATVSRETAGNPPSSTDERFYLSQVDFQFGYTIWDRLVWSISGGLGGSMYLGRLSTGWKFQHEYGKGNVLHILPLVESSYLVFQVKEARQMEYRFPSVGLVVGSGGINLRASVAVGSISNAFIGIEFGSQ